MKTRDILLALNQLNKINTKVELLQVQLNQALLDDNILSKDFQFEEIITLANTFHANLSSLCDNYRNNLTITYKNNANGVSPSET